MTDPQTLSSGIVDVICGENVKLVEPCNVYGCELGDDVFVGPFVEIQKGVRVGARTRIQSHTFVCEFVTLGHDCVIAHGVMFINDLYRIGGPANGNKDLWSCTEIGNHVSIGSNATILPVRICDQVVIGAGSVVTKDINQSGIYAGNPAKKLREIGAIKR
jgi:acetyltransferase-like isoleucine patch superfamily enzyme